MSPGLHKHLSLSFLLLLLLLLLLGGSFLRGRVSRTRLGVALSYEVALDRSGDAPGCHYRYLSQDILVTRPSAVLRAIVVC